MKEKGMTHRKHPRPSKHLTTKQYNQISKSKVSGSKVYMTVHIELCTNLVTTVHITVTTKWHIHHNFLADGSKVFRVKGNFFLWFAQSSLWTSTGAAFTDPLGMLPKGTVHPA